MDFSFSTLACNVQSVISMGRSKLDIEKAIKHLEDHAEEGSTGHCARYVREALKAGGVIITPAPGFAKDYGPALLHKGFIELLFEDCSPAKGDICVIQPYSGGNPAGHIQMFTGEEWISDFVNNSGFWPGPGYRSNKPAYAIYRP